MVGEFIGEAKEHSRVKNESKRVRLGQSGNGNIHGGTSVQVKIQDSVPHQSFSLEKKR